MRRLIPCGAMLLAALLVLPITSSGQQKNKLKQDTVTKEDATSQDYANLAQVKEIVGKITDLDVKEQTMTFTIEWSHVELNPNPPNAAKLNTKAAKLQQQLLRDYNSAVSTSDPIHRQQALTKFQVHLQQLQAAGNAAVMNMFQVLKSSKDFNATIMDKVKVARLQLEQKYNDEGEEVKYTAEELKKLKSPDITGAYKATSDDLKVGQSVKLYLSPPKKQDAKKTDKGANTSDKDAKATDKDAVKSDQDTKKTDQEAKKSDSSSGSASDKTADSSTQSDRPQVRMILIIDEPAITTDPPDTTTKKKK